MKIHNCLPLLLECLNRWKQCPSEEEFNREYRTPMVACAGDFFSGYHEVLLELNWDLYRAEALRIDPDREEKRFRGHLQRVEDLFEFPLLGESILMGAFTGMDGYARFDRGTHQVFLGVDESHGRGQYMDILMVHELCHVARESRPEVWEGFGLDPKMTQDEFREYQPVIEHLMGEGFSCAVSEILVPNQPAWEYAYQTQDSLAQVLQHGPALDRLIRKELRHPEGDYGRFYGIQPLFAHYVWAWQWTKDLLKTHANGDPRQMVARCSKEFFSDALQYQLKNLS